MTCSYDFDILTTPFVFIPIFYLFILNEKLFHNVKANNIILNLSLVCSICSIFGIDKNDFRNVDYLFFCMRSNKKNR